MTYFEGKNGGVRGVRGQLLQAPVDKSGLRGSKRGYFGGVKVVILEGQDLPMTDYNSKIWARSRKKEVKNRGKFGHFQELSQKCKEEAVKLIKRVEYPEKRVKYPVN